MKEHYAFLLNFPNIKNSSYKVNMKQKGAKEKWKKKNM